MTNPQKPSGGIPPRPQSFKTPGLPQSDETARMMPRAEGEPDMPPQPSEGNHYETPTRRLGGMNEGRASARDIRGRMITVRRLNLLDYYRLSKILGETAGNEQAMNLATLTCAVTEIDSEPVFFPNSEREIQALMQRIDFDGLGAVTDALKMLAPPPTEGDDQTTAAKN